MARFVRANGLRFAYESYGDDGPLALLVHGFPDTPATWRHLGPRLAAAGFRVVAPWTRGYAPSEVPTDGNYRIDTLASDLNRLHDVLDGDERAVLVGHDWGAVAAYVAAVAGPRRWQRVVTLSVPPEPVLARRIRSLRQLGRSWYTIAAQFPVEQRIVARDLVPLADLWREWSPGYVPTEDDLAPLRSSLRSPENLRAALGYYRAQRRDLLRRRILHPDRPVPRQPTLYLHGAQDRCMLADVAGPAHAALGAANRRSRAEVVDDTGHFLHLERPGHVGARIEAWLTVAPDA